MIISYFSKEKKEWVTPGGATHSPGTVIEQYPDQH